jgi:chromate transporter
MTNVAAPPPAPATVEFGEALRFWLKLGFISFGGPAGQIAIMHQELVERRRWISERRFLHALNYCMLLPGPEAQQLATYIGWLLHRTRGGIVAGVLFVLPSLFVITTLAWVYLRYGHLPLLTGVFYGIKPAVIAIVAHAAWRIGRRALTHRALWLIAAIALFLIQVAQAPFPLVVGLAALAGFAGARFAPQVFGGGGAHAETKTSYGPALVDDATPTPAHAIWHPRRALRVLAVGALLWALPMAGLTLYFGWQHTLTQVGWFFSKAAMLTFGGAYAVLPYVFQSAVEHYGWVDATQMMDGLALGEATPGPLIMIVAFVAFIGGYGGALFGPEQLALAGAVAALLATWFTFLPSFVFVLLGGPLMESTRNAVHFTAPLTAITAAVVGVIANLALFFAVHVLWPAGFGGRFDAVAALLAVAAMVALFRYRCNAIHVLAVGAVLGLILQTLLQ